ncbi:MAG: nitroreductase [Gammaproteobacteria bacterium]|nr:MAG: nitroreductase [Gammaproteobacteria bacterium]
MDKPASTSVPIHPLLAARWSPRAIDPEAPVGEAEVLALLEAARWAPSCYGEEPWRLVVCDRQRDRQAWEAAMATLAEGNRLWARHAPVLVLVAAAPRFTHKGKPNRWAAFDAGAACENLLLQATALGLAAHPMGGFDEEAARAALGVPEDHLLMAFVAVGRPGDPATLPEELRQRELAPRQRQPLGSRCYAGRWGRPADQVYRPKGA